jgi:hypothetical protein
MGLATAARQIHLHSPASITMRWQSYMANNARNYVQQH